jgi:hypothetical protein
MKIKLTTPDQMILDETPWFLGILLSAYILGAMGLGLTALMTEPLKGVLVFVLGGGVGIGCFALFIRRTQVILDRSSNGITIREKSLFGYSVTEHKLSELSHAVVEQHSTSDEEGHSSRVSLILSSGMSEGVHPLTNSFSSSERPVKRLCRAINEWLDQAAS